MNEYFSNVNFIDVFKKRIKLFIVMSILAVGISGGVSFMLDPLYRSTAVIYPSNLSSFSEESPSEQLLQILSSDDIKFKFIDKFKLMDHYKIDPNDQYRQTKLILGVTDNVKIYKTEYQSVNIDVTDTDPKIACDMVNELIKMVNVKILGMHRERFNEKVKIWKNEMALKHKEMDSIKGKIDSLRVKSEIIDFDAQVKEASRQYFTMTKSDAPNANNYLSKFMKKLQGNGAEVFSLTQSFNIAVNEYNRVKLLYEAALVDFKKELNYTNVVAKPYVADRKIYPLRWLIVLVSLISALVVTAITVVIIDKNNIEKK